MKNDKIIKLFPKNSADNPDLVMEQCIGEFEDVFVLGYDKKGFFDFRASSGLTNEQALYLLKTFEHKLMNGDYSPECGE